MNFLQLAQRLRQEAGVSGSGPASVTGQTGEMKRIVDWITAAYEDIQNLHPNWEFLRTDFTFPTIASTQTYLPSAVSIDDHASWKMDSMRAYLTSTGVNDEQGLEICSWNAFRDVYLLGSQRSVTGRPIKVALKPNKALAFWPTPDNVYTVVGEYFKEPQTMSDNSDEPNFPSRFHMILVWTGLKYYATYESAPELYAKGEKEYTRLLSGLELDQLPEMYLGTPLA